MQRRRICEKYSGVKKWVSRSRFSPGQSYSINVSERTNLRKGYFIINGIVLQSLRFVTHTINITQYISKEKNKVDDRPNGETT